MPCTSKEMAQFQAADSVSTSAPDVPAALELVHWLSWSTLHRQHMTVVCGKAYELSVVATTGASNDLVLKSCEQIVYRIKLQC